jgi:hypothetical protein
VDVTPTPAPPGTPTVISVGAALLQQGKVLPGFAQFAMTGEDNLRITVCGSIVGAVINVQGRFLDVTTSQVVPFGFQVALPSNRVATSTLFALGTGYLLNLTAFAQGPASLILGQAYVKIDIVRGLTGSTYLLGTLIAGYVTNNQALGFPGSPILDSLQGEPALRDISLGTIALGSEFSFVCPTGARWELVSLRCIFVTSAVAGLRFPRFVIANAFLAVTSVTTNNIGVGQSTVADYTFAPNLPTTVAGQINQFMAPTPFHSVLLAGDAWQTSTTGLDPGDQYSSVAVEIREWLEVN